MSGAAVWMMLGVLALEALVLIAVAGLIARRVKSPHWDRTIWQGCFAALLGLVVLEFSGGARALGRVAVREPQKMEQAVFVAPSAPRVPTPAANPAAPHVVPVRDGTDGMDGWNALEVAQGARLVQGTPVAPVVRGSGNSLLFARIFVGAWLLGALLIFGLHVVVRFRFVRLLRRSPEVDNPTLMRRVEELASTLGMRRRVRVFESSLLVSPIAWGIVRPAVGLPPRFEEESSPCEQDAMLAHELAHLAAGDPAWYLLADLLDALLWWHPLVKWAKRRLHAASESSADEASLLVLDGPGVLAQSLVALGARLERPRPAAWLGIEGAGFRSGLARRVERLLKISGGKWSPPGRVWAFLARTFVPGAIVVGLLFCVAWTVPETSTHGETMKQWKQSIGLLGLMTTLVVSEEPVRAADTVKTNPPNPETPVSNKRIAATTAGELKLKLETIVLDEISYDGLPLVEIIKSLRSESVSRDPQKVGVNFLFGQASEPIRPSGPAVDPATGLPVGTPVSFAELTDVTTTTIRIMPPLKKVRLLDALDAIVRVADRPIKYTIEGYAVVWAPDAERINALATGVPGLASAQAASRSLQTRAFKVDTNVFFSSLGHMFRLAPNPSGSDTGDMLRDYVFPKFGAVLSRDQPVLYNPLTGVVLVRASTEQMVTIQACMDALSGAATTPVQIGELSRRENPPGK